MGNIWTGSEIVELGVQIEKNGRDFYNVLAVISRNRKAKDMFKYLAEEEERHIKVFQEILGKAGKYEPQGVDADAYFSYMKVLADDYIFTRKDKGRKIAKTIKTEKEALEKGIAFEKDSIIFYAGMKRLMPEYEQKAADELIAQEEEHLIKLSGLRKKG